MRFIRALVPAVVLAVLSTGSAAAESNATPADVREFMKDYREWGAAPTVEAYMDLFTPDATLMDSGLTAPIDLPRIRAQIESVLRVVPDYRFEPYSATATSDGKLVFVQARNTGTVRGQAVSFVTTHRLLLVGSKVRQGRRFWDQTELFRPVAPDLPNLFADLGPAASAVSAPAIAQRQWAWNTKQSAALIAGPSLSGPGLPAPSTGRTAIKAYLDRLFGAVDRLDLRLGHEIHRNGEIWLEWTGMASIGGEHARTVQFGIVERLAFQPHPTWSLAFDTLDMVASPQRITELRALIFG